MSMAMRTLCYIGLNLCSLYIIYKIVVHFIYPKIIDFTTKETERNPQWLTGYLRSNYYGFEDIDFIVCECPVCHVPRFRVPKDANRLELFVPDDFSNWDREKVAKIALMGKIKIRHGLDTSMDKPLYWLSILCYMLEGGDINISETSWGENRDSEKRQENS